MSTELSTWLSDLAVWDADLNLDDDVSCEDCDRAAVLLVLFDCPTHRRFALIQCEPHGAEIVAAARAPHMRIRHRPCDAVVAFVRWEAL